MANSSDRVLARRQRDLDGWIERYDQQLEASVGQYAQNLRPTWERLGQTVQARAKTLYEQAGAMEDPVKLRSLRRQAGWLDNLSKDIANDLKDVEDRLQPYFTGSLKHEFERAYYLNAFGLEQAAKVAVAAPVITPMQVLGVLANPWLPDGANYSDRLRANTAYLAGKMRGEIAKAVAMGQGWNETARRIEAVAGEGYFNSVRLARTELNRAAALASSYTFMQNSDILDGKRWNATLDSRTAAKDAANDGKLYDLDYDTPGNPGVAGQRIPNHPNCRCKYSPVVSSLGVSQRERIARGTDDTPNRFGERAYTKSRTYREYAEKRGLPNLDARLAAENPKRYLRPGETINDLNKAVVRWTYNGNTITVPRPIWEQAKLQPGEKEIVPQDVFKPASSVKEAEGWAKDNLDIDLVEYKGYHINLANDVNKTIHDLQRRFPEIRDIKYMGTAQARNKAFVERKLAEKGLGNKKKYVDDYIQAAVAREPRLNDAQGRAILKEQAERFFKEDVARYKRYYAPKRINGRVYAQATNDTWGPQQGISFNEKWAKDYDTLSRAVARDARSGWRPVGTENPASIMTHEFGHQVDYYLRQQGKRGWVDQLWDDYRRQVRSAGGNSGDIVSRYADENSAEMFAEAFSEYYHNPNPRPFAKAFGEQLEAVLTGIRGAK